MRGEFQGRRVANRGWLDFCRRVDRRWEIRGNGWPRWTTAANNFRPLPSQTRVKEERTRVNGISKSTDVFLLGSFYFLRFRLIYTSGALQLHSRGLQVSFSFGLTGSLGERDLVRWYERGRNV